jgi:hypothetical protein
MMRRFCIGMSLVIAAAMVCAQGSQPSPKQTASATIAGKTITIVYCSPRVGGREGHIFAKGGLIEQTHQSYPVWRAGANAATTLKTTGAISLGDLNVPAGTHTLFVDISNPAQWTLIVSNDVGEWGLSYDKSKDLGRVPMHMSKPPALVEDLTYTIKHDGGNKGTLTLAWENESASVPITVH